MEDGMAWTMGGSETAEVERLRAERDAARRQAADYLYQLERANRRLQRITGSVELAELKLGYGIYTGTRDILRRALERDGLAEQEGTNGLPR